MANSPQSKKRARQIEKRFAVNKARRSRIRTYLRKVEEAIASGNKDAAATALKAASMVWCGLNPRAKCAKINLISGYFVA